MSTSPLSFLNTNYLQSILGNAVKNAGLNISSASTSSTQQPDSSQLSPFAQLLSTLQQLQESNPTEYKQVTGQIATNLQDAAQTATTDGNTNAANQLNQLATDFTNASQSGQLPNIADLAQAIGGGGGHHHHHHFEGGDSSSTSSTNSSSSSSSASSSATSSSGAGNSSSPLDQLLAAFQSNANQNESLNPMSIIVNTLTNAGISISNS